MAGSGSKCKNQRNHNCSECPHCGAIEHDYDQYGRCSVCGEWEDDNSYEGKLGGGGFQRIKGRIIKKHFDDEDDY